MKRFFLAVAFFAFLAGCEKSGDAESTVIEVRDSEISVGAEARSGVQIRYALRLPAESQPYASSLRVEASSNTSWISNIDCEAEGVVAFDVDENKGLTERYGVVVLSFQNAEDVKVLVIQAVSDGTGDDNNDDDDDDDDKKDDDDPKGDDGKDDNPSISNVYRTGWAELPTESSTIYPANTLYYAHHLCAGGEKNAQNNGKARNYTVCFSSEYHCPVWVAAPRHSMYEGSANRTDAYAADPDIPSNIQYNSKSTGGDCNKGHMLGSAERTSSSATNRQVFYYTNIAPQYSSNFNTGGGGWNVLEDWVDSKVCSDTTYVVIGTYFDSYTDKRGYSASPKKIEFGGRSDVSCPTMFYYILLRTKRGNTGKSVMNCSKDELMCAAFVRAHSKSWTTSTSQNRVSQQDMMSVAELEKLTGFSYFPNVPNAPKDTFNASDWGL